MAATQKAKVPRQIAAKAQRLLEFAERRAKQTSDWLELHFAIYGVGGKANELFTTQSERTAFARTPQYKRLLELMDSLPRPASKGLGELVSTANGAISVRLPRSVHAALLAEAQAEGVSLNQLCVSKLVAQLRALV
jgi:hypothetical protein